MDFIVLLTLMTEDAKHLSSCMAFSFFGEVLFRFFPFFKVSFILLLLAFEVLYMYIFFILNSLQIYDLQIFFYLFRQYFSLLLIVSSDTESFSVLVEIQFIYFLLLLFVLLVSCWIHFQIQDHEILVQFLKKSLIVLALIFSSLNIIGR